MNDKHKITVENKKTGGLGFPSILTLIFVVSKLLNIIDWSWWLVFSPFLISVGLVTIILIGVVIVALCTK